MLDNAITLAVLTTAGFWAIYKKMPPNIRSWVTKHSIIMDILAMLITYWVLGGTVTALIAGALVNIFISVMLHVANNPQDFIWLFDMADRIKKAWEGVQEKLKTLNTEYKDRHPGASSPQSQSLGNVDPILA